MLKIAWSELYSHPLPENHRFPMEKYELLPKQLLHEGTVEEANFFKPVSATEDQILAVHDPDYWNRLKYQELTRSEIRATGFPLSKQLVDREINIAGGTIECATHALETIGVGMNIAGGTHHAYTNRGEGFCLLNDQAMASQFLLNSHHLNNILIVDLDVHQGNGTAEIFENESRVFTFSMHGEKNYPVRKEKSDLDVGLPDGCDDETYLDLLKEHLLRLLDELRPEFMFFQSGVDILETDKLGRLGLTVEACKERDRLVIQEAKNREIPLVICMGGGYSEDIKVIVEAHANTFRLAQEIHY